ncbi:hypothetical protein QVD17_33603 [Tagetes erecta]|uniref:Uncharacterized protein n=1 Tax=Tagetes erecta TaxID=13708 RepID=A0AAD8JWX8_TARER|nr:hypothetical protein QVD17_33603 [Tagetes erecta]
MKSCTITHTCQALDKCWTIDTLYLHFWGLFCSNLIAFLGLFSLHFVALNLDFPLGAKVISDPNPSVTFDRTIA